MSVSDLPELTVAHVNAAGVLLNAASTTGVFKLPQFAQVSIAFNECRRIVGEEGINLSEVPVNGLILIHNVLEYAANNNGFKIDDYDAVVKVIVIFANFLKPHMDELAKKKQEEEASKGVEEEKEGVEEEKSE
jgi:hypothetical protein